MGHETEFSGSLQRAVTYAKEGLLHPHLFKEDITHFLIRSLMASLRTSEYDFPEFNYDVIVFGGGTGPISLLEGLTKLNTRSKILTVPTGWDSGGSTGILRTKYGVYPQGDARRQEIALQPNPELQDILRSLYQHRMYIGDEQHAIGNLIIGALDQLYPGEGMQKALKLHGIESKILLPSKNALELFYKVKHKEFYGEHNLDERAEEVKRDPTNKISSIYFGNPAIVNEELIKAIKKAQKIVFSPGSLYGSTLPFLLIDEVREAILNSPAELYYDLNIMTEPGQTDGFKGSNHVSEFNRYIQTPDRLNYLVAHVNHIPVNGLERYEREGQVPVEVDEEAIMSLSPKLKIVKGIFASYLDSAHLIRNNPIPFARVHLATKQYLAELAKAA